MKSLVLVSLFSLFGVQAAAQSKYNCDADYALCNSNAQAASMTCKNQSSNDPKSSDQNSEQICMAELAHAEALCTHQFHMCLSGN